MSISDVNCVCRTCDVRFPLGANKSAGLCEGCAKILGAKECVQCFMCQVVYWDTELIEDRCDSCVTMKIKKHINDNLCEMTFADRVYVLQAIEMKLMPKAYYTRGKSGKFKLIKDNRQRKFDLLIKTEK